MILTASCDSCGHEEEVSLWNAGDFDLGDCELCGEGMCERCCEGEHGLVHTECHEDAGVEE